MNKLNNGTNYRTVSTGYVLARGNREVYLIAKSVNASNKAKEMIANNSFDRLFKAGRTAPQMRNTSYLKVMA